MDHEQMDTNVQPIFSKDKTCKHPVANYRYLWNMHMENLTLKWCINKYGTGGQIQYEKKSFGSGSKMQY